MNTALRCVRIPAWIPVGHRALAVPTVAGHSRRGAGGGLARAGTREGVTSDPLKFSRPRMS